MRCTVVWSQQGYIADVGSCACRCWFSHYIIGTRDVYSPIIAETCPVVDFPISFITSYPVVSPLYHCFPTRNMTMGQYLEPQKLDDSFHKWPRSMAPRASLVRFVTRINISSVPAKNGPIGRSVESQKTSTGHTSLPEQGKNWAHGKNSVEHVTMSRFFSIGKSWRV